MREGTFLHTKTLTQADILASQRDARGDIEKLAEVVKETKFMTADEVHAAVMQITHNHRHVDISYVRHEVKAWVRANTSAKRMAVLIKHSGAMQNLRLY